MLEIEALHAGYGETRIIQGLDLRIEAGRLHAILGRNGVGKSTTLKTVMGLLPVIAGRIDLNGQSLNGLAPFQIAKRGLAYVPETRDIFGSLSVLENLRLAERLCDAPDRSWDRVRIFEFFPQLAKRQRNGGNQLSGGEQQMLAIARALLMNPKILILDEPTEGLAPIVVRQIFDKLAELKATGMTILLVEQNIRFATSLADTVSILGRGQCVWAGPPRELRDNRQLHEQWLGV